jgi:hypothetical protein
MVYKNKEDQRAADRRWWARNSERENAKRYEKLKIKRAWFQNLREKLSCIHCGEDHPACLDFHHIQPKRKELSIMVQRGGYSRKSIEDEMKKCIVLCGNCHRKEHAREKHAK